MRTMFFYIALLFLSSCSKIQYYDDNPIITENTHILAHRGAMGSDSILSNTFAAVRIGLASLDGVEVDIQLSEENTLWLGHDSKVLDCDGVEHCFNELSHQELLEIQVCDLDERFSPLEVIFVYMRSFYPEKYISLDIKRPECGVFAQEEYDIVAKKIVQMAKQYGMEENILVESGNKKFLRTLRELSSDLKLYFLAWDEYDYGLTVAIENDLTGISFDFNRGYEITFEHIELAHRKGVQMMLWVINDTLNMRNVYDMSPDFIQTDDLDYYDYLDQ